MTEFTWPCNRRYAHGKHTMKPADDPWGDGGAECEGVKSHPNTMIGGNLRLPIDGAGDDDGIYRSVLPDEDVIERIDKYNITVNGVRVTADSRQEMAIMNMTREQRANLVKILGGQADPR